MDCGYDVCILDREEVGNNTGMSVITKSGHEIRIRPHGIQVIGLEKSLVIPMTEAESFSLIEELIRSRVVGSIAQEEKIRKLISIVEKSK